MHVGKSGVMRCDHCGEVAVDMPDSVKIGDKLRHFCNGTTCMEEFFIDRYRDAINTEVAKQVREEFNFLHKQVCPACRYRIVTRTNKLFTKAG